jgi:hypothetical protein
MTRALMHAALFVVMGAACASTQAAPAGDSARVVAQQAAIAPVRVVVDPAARFWYAESLPLGHASPDSLVNQNGSPRITDVALYDRYWKEHAPTMAQWSADPRLRINPNFVAAIMAKESGFDPLATSAVPANGIAQMTYIADEDLRIIARDAPAWRWMYDEVRRWPRSPVVHDSLARKSRTDSLLRSGQLGPRTEYLFDPRTSTRAALFWLRVLAHVWTEDTWPGQYGTMARTKLANGGPLSETDLLALVTVSYNQGQEYVGGLVQKYGRDWTQHLNEESGDYLERISHYTAIFQRAARGR